MKPLKEGPLARFFREISNLQKFERQRKQKDPSYSPRLRTVIVTARNAPAHKRVVATLRKWGIEVDEVFFWGELPKTACSSKLSRTSSSTISSSTLKASRASRRARTCLLVSLINQVPIWFKRHMRNVSGSKMERRSVRPESGRDDVSIRSRPYGSLKSPLCSCGSITLPATSQTRITAQCERL